MSVPPSAPRRPATRRHHGDLVEDPYAWMQDRDDPDLITYLAAENAWTQTATAGQAGLRQEIHAEISGRTRQTDLSVPEFSRDSTGRAWWYYLRTTEGKDYASYHRLPASDPDDVPVPDAHRGSEQTILDGNALAAGTDFFALGMAEVSPDGNRLAFSVDLRGDERYLARFSDLRTGEVLPHELSGIAAGGCWCGDDAFLYLTVDDAWRPDACWRLDLTSGESRLLHREPDERFWLGVAESRDRSQVMIVAAAKNTSETLLLGVEDTEGLPHPVAPRREGVEYDVEVGPDRLYLWHNDGAPDFALAEAPLDCTDAAQWRTVWPGAPGVRLLGVSAYHRALVWSVRREGLSRVLVQPRDAHGTLGEPVELDFGEELFTAEASGSEDVDTDRIRLSFQSFITPEQVLEYRFDTAELRVLKQRVVLDLPGRGPYRPQDYRQRREWVSAPDGTQIPLSLVYRADTPLDGSAGCLLYGYGAYEVSLDPAFSIARLSLLDRGYLQAIAHVRGGGELGRDWYEQGRLAAKENTFTDFIASARHLVSHGFTSTARLAIEGGSAGGLLIGAALNAAPDAFGAAHAAVPFVDALTAMLDPSLPLTVTEWEEWGDPLHHEEDYWRMKQWTPYENVGDLPYPALLVTASLLDTRVEISEPAKWVARLRHDAPRAGELLLHTELEGGHGGASGRSKEWRDAAFELAWLISATSVPEST